jgi:nucleotide-binding universal stress UspA family protein
MNRLKQIVVGIDFSECSRSALRQTVRMASWNTARLHVVHALNPVDLAEAAVALRVSETKARQQSAGHCSQRLKQWLEEEGVAGTATMEVGVGAPLDVLMESVARVSADLLALGVSGTSEDRQTAGTLATKALRKSPCKVMLVKDGHGETLKKVVACVDFSDACRETVVQALRVASQDRCEVHFLHVFNPHWSAWGFLSEAPAFSDFEANYRSVLENNLRQFVDASGGINSVYAVRGAKSHAQGIADYCDEQNIDLAIMGTKGRTDARYVLLGSTVEKLLRRIPCSMLAVRPPVNRLQPAGF